MTFHPLGQHIHDFVARMPEQSLEAILNAYGLGRPFFITRDARIVGIAGAHHYNLVYMALYVAGIRHGVDPMEHRDQRTGQWLPMYARDVRAWGLECSGLVRLRRHPGGKNEYHVATHLSPAQLGLIRRMHAEPYHEQQHFHVVHNGPEREHTGWDYASLVVHLEQWRPRFPEVRLKGVPAEEWPVCDR